MKMRLFIVLLYGVFEFIQPALAVVDFNTLYPRLLNMSDPREDPQFINAFERDSGKTAERFLESVTPEKLVSLPEPILKRLIQLSNFNHNQFFLFDRSTLTEEERHKWLSTLLGADLHKQRTAAIKQEKRIWLFRNKKSYDKNLALITEALNFISVNPEIISSSLNEELAATVNFILLNAPRHLKYGFATEILRNLLLSYTRLLNKFARSNTSETLLSEHVDNLKILFMSFSNSYSHWTMQLPFKVKQELAELRAVTFVDELVDKSNISVF
ncbi:MAG: hypothetical protein JWQ35_123, partial [Bacteriovoracaceae bacterium]|nr:hypothetical protein [Bacteriovoracaceae bacterium]